MEGKPYKMEDNKTPSELLSTGSFLCAICGESGCSRCINCRKVWYCSKPHQKKDWKRHKEECYPGRVSKSEEFGGRFLQATRNIGEGELVLRENIPLFSAPNGKDGLYVLCLVCYGPISKELEQTEGISCPNCKWPLHKGCVEDPEHVQNECCIFAKCRITPSSKELNIYDKILVLRGCLLKLKNARKWSLLQQLESHRKFRQETEEGQSLSKSMQNFVLEKCLLALSLTPEEVDHVVGVVVINAYVTEDNLTSSPDFKSGSFIYFNGSMPAHNCIPNCKWTIDGKALKLWALRGISEGECLSHCYAWGGTGTLERQKHLLKSKFFSCGCDRCKDPEELGSFFSAVKCPCNKKRKCPGYLVSEAPTNIGAKWKCSKCKDEMTEEEIESVVKRWREEHTKISNSTPNHTPNWRQVLSQLEAHLKLLQETVHPNHFLVQEVEQDILLRISYILNNPNLTESEKVLDKQELCTLAQKNLHLSRKSLALLEIIAPGMTTHVGRQLYYLQQALGSLILERIERQENTPELHKDVEEWKQVRKRGALILGVESKGREEYVLGEAMQYNSENVP